MLHLYTLKTATLHLYTYIENSKSVMKYSLKIFNIVLIYCMLLLESHMSICTTTYCMVTWSDHVNPPLYIILLLVDTVVKCL